MKAKLLTTIGLCAFTTSSFALINIGEGQIDMKVTGSVMHDSRITAQSGAPEDTIFSLTTAFTYVRKSPRFDLQATAGIRIDEYMDNSQFNDENVFFDLAINPEAEIRTSRIRFSGNLILNSDTRSNEDIGGIITTNEYGVNGQLVYDPNRHYTVVFDGSTRVIDPDGGTYSRTRDTSAGLRVELPVNKQMAGFGGVRFTQHLFDGDTGVDSDSMAYFVGANGTLFSRMNGSLSVGLQERSLDDGPNSTAPYVAASLTWAQSERTQVELTANNSFSTTLNEYNTEVMRVGANLTHKLNRLWSLGGNIGFSDTSYESGILPDRSDEEYYAGMQVNRKVGDWGQVGVSLRYSDRSSDVDEFSYSRLRVGATVSGKW